MKCNAKIRLVGGQKKTNNTHKKINGKYDWNSETTQTEIRYEQDSICKNGHVGIWQSHKPFTDIKWKCARAIYSWGNAGYSPKKRNL